ncbi:hypothetical protein ACLB2K_066054 [Fragaria x ananassa]
MGLSPVPFVCGGGSQDHLGQTILLPILAAGHQCKIEGSLRTSGLDSVSKDLTGEEAMDGGPVEPWIGYSTSVVGVRYAAMLRGVAAPRNCSRAANAKVILGGLGVFGPAWVPLDMRWAGCQGLFGVGLKIM